jgi:uncharacterized protein YneR
MGGKPGCEAASAMPPGVLNCSISRERGGCRLLSDMDPPDMNFMRMKIGDKATGLEGYSTVDLYDKAVDAQVRQAALIFNYQYVDTQFQQSGTAEAIRAEWEFGLPLEGYKNAEDNFKEQRKKIEDFVWDAIYEDKDGGVGLKLYAEGLEREIPEMEIVFNGEGMFQNYFNMVLAGDGSKTLMSMVFIFLYMVVMLRSWFLGGMGILQILGAFFPAYFLYRFIFQQKFFGPFNILSIFIILGIGADDIFVFMDTWASAENHGSDLAADTHKRISFTWRHAAKAMAVTSATTFASFLCNASSVFPGISTFGIFTGMLVLVNYCAVITYWPTCVALYHSKFESKPFCCGLGGFCAKRPEGVPERTKSEHNDNEYSGIVAFMHGPYANAVITYKFPIVILFIVLQALMVYNAVQLEVDDEAMKFLPDDDNFQKFNPTKARYFARGGGIFNIEVGMAFGFSKGSPIDRSGTAPTNASDYGTALWHEDFNLWFSKSVDGKLHSVMGCMLKICEEMEKKSEERRTAGPPSNVAKCWVRKFKDWINSSRKCCSDLPSAEQQAAYAAGRCRYHLWDRSFDQIVQLGHGDPLGQVPDGGTGEANQIQIFTGRCTQYDPEAEFWRSIGKSAPGWLPWVEWMQMNSNANYNEYKEHFYAQDVDEPQPDGSKLVRTKFRFTTQTVKLLAEQWMSYKDGIKLDESWEAWSKSDEALGSPECTAVSEHISGFQYTPDTWHFYYVNERMVKEAFTGIALALGISYLVLSAATQNPYSSFVSIVIIGCLVCNVISFAKLMGWKLGIMESVNFVMVPGMAVDYVAHMAEGYLECEHPQREKRVRHMLTEVGISVISGAVSTLGATVFLFMCVMQFFKKFGMFIFFTILCSCVYALILYPALMAILGPAGNFGNLRALCSKQKPQASTKISEGAGNGKSSTDTEMAIKTPTTQ